MEIQEETKSELSSLQKQEIEEDEIIKSSEEYARDFPASPPWLTPSDEEQRQQEFSDSFNDGYSLAKNDPEGYDAVLWDIEDDRERSNGLIWGKWIFEQELGQAKSTTKEQKNLSEIQSIRNKSNERSNEPPKQRLFENLHWEREANIEERKKDHERG